MDTLYILFVLPLLIVFSYLFDSFSRKTKFPSVILLMITGILFRFLISFSGYDNFTFLDNLIPVLGTIGLILIVLEGAIELEISRKKLPLILKGFLAAFIILVVNIFVLKWIFENIFDLQNTVAALFAIPLSIISSAVAIPSATGLIDHDREFVIYESTFSDILGIMIFNYALRQYESKQALIGADQLISLGLQIIGVIVISLLITYVLFKLIQQIDHHVKFFLILALLILVYAFGKLFHLPALVTIFIFGIFISNAKNLLPRIFRNYIDLDNSKNEIHEFHILTAESTFLVRTFFFLFFGFSIKVSDFGSITPLLSGIVIFLVMLFIRYLYFSFTTLKFKPSPITYMSPRGLISILLFIQLKDVAFINLEQSIIDEHTLLIVILVSMLVMLGGTIKKQKGPNEIIIDNEESFSVEMDIDPSELSNDQT